MSSTSQNTGAEALDTGVNTTGNKKKGVDFSAKRNFAIESFVENAFEQGSDKDIDRLNGKTTSHFQASFLRFVTIAHTELLDKSVPKDLSADEWKKITEITNKIALEKAVLFAEAKKNILAVFTWAYVIDAAQKANITGALEKLGLDEVRALVWNRCEACAWLKSKFSTIVEKDVFNGLPAWVQLTPEQLATLKNITSNASTPPTSQDTKEFLKFFSSIKQDPTVRERLILHYLPNITLADAISLKLLEDWSYEQIRTSLFKEITSDSLKTEAQKEEKDKGIFEEFLRKHKNEIRLSTKDLLEHNNSALKDEIAEKLFSSSVFLSEISQDIAGDVERVNKEQTLPNEKLGRGFPRRDENGQLLGDVESVFKSALGINANTVADFSHCANGQGSVFLRGKFNGQEVVFHVSNILPKEHGTGPQMDDSFIEILEKNEVSGNYHMPSGISQEHCSMSRLYNILSGLESPQFETKEWFQQYLSDAKSGVLVPGQEIQNVKELKDKIDDFDHKGTAFGFEVNTTFYGKAGNGMQAFRITSATADQIKITNGENSVQTFGNGSTQSLADFYAAFEQGHFGRIPPLNNASSFLHSLVETFSKKSWEFAKIEYKEDYGFVENGQKNEKEPPKISEFISADEKTVIEIVSVDGNKADIIYHEDVSENKEKKRKAKKSSHATLGWEMLYTLIIEQSMKPNFNAGSEQNLIEEKHSHLHEHSGYAARWMQWYSITDILSGGKKVVEHIKHKLEHNSKTHASRATLMWAGLIGMDKWNSHWYDGLRADEQSSEKKMLEETLGHLNGMNPPKVRHEHIMHMLQNRGAPQYEYIAAALCMLEKHGTLYTGDSLKKHEGSYLFFKRICGIPLDVDATKTPQFQDALSKLQGSGGMVREEALIFIHLRTIGGEGKINPSFWNMVKMNWKKGMEGEWENGKNEAKSMNKLDAKLQHVLFKFKGKEYAAGLGALEPIFSQGGDAWQMHLTPMLLAMTDIPSRLREEQFKSLYLMPFGGHTYPGLWFIQSPDHQILFQKVFKRLINESGNNELKADYASLPSNTNDDYILKFYDFWKKHGNLLAPKLCCSPTNPEIFAKKDKPGYEDYKRYYDSYASIFGDPNFKISADEEQNNAYKNNHSSFFLISPKSYLDRINPGGGHGVIERTEEIARFQEVVDGVSTVRDVETNDEKSQKELFKHYHKAIMNKFMRAKGDIYKLYEAKKTLDHIEKLRGVGISFPKEAELIGSVDAYLESGLYERHLERDFRRFLAGESYKPDAQEEVAVAKVRTQNAINTILKQDSNSIKLPKQNIPATPSFLQNIAKSGKKGKRGKGNQARA